MNPKALELIKSFEGLRLKSYQDQGGRWTVGYGSTGPGIQAGTEWSLEQAEERLELDVSRIEEGVKELVKAPINAGQEAALISFAYNLGLHNLQRSGLLRLLNLRNYKGAADQFLLWDRIGSYVSPGLTKRREQERKVFLS